MTLLSASPGPERKGADNRKNKKRMVVKWTWGTAQFENLKRRDSETCIWWLRESNFGSFENKLSVQVPVSHLSEPTKPTHLQNYLNFPNYSKGKPTGAESMPVGEKHYEPILQVTTPPIPSVVLFCLSPHITSLHFLKWTVYLNLFHLRISQQFSVALERTLCSPLFFSGKLPWQRPD